MRVDGSHGSGAPYRTWSVDKGVGYCISRSRNHGRRLGHLFVCKQTAPDTVYPGEQQGRPEPGVTVHCAWCWKRQD